MIGHYLLLSALGRGQRSKSPITVLLLNVSLAVVCHVTYAEDNTSTPCRPMSDEGRLHDCLLTNLNPTVRPAQNASNTVNVSFGGMMLKILDVDEKTHVMTTIGWIHYHWEDFQLKWEPDQYGGLKQIRLPIDKIWQPDIVLFNNADDSYKYTFDNLAQVTNDGKVTWVPHARMRSYCTLDLRRFPFDTQSCTQVFGSWTHDTKSVNITLHEKFKKPLYVMDSHEWTATSVESKRHEWSYHPTEQYSGVITTIKLKRTSSFYQYVFIMPTVLFAFAILMVPFIHPTSQERITYCVALLLGCVLVLMMLERHMPTEIGTVPVVAAYLAYLMVMTMISLFFTLLVTNMYHREPKQGKVPGWIRWIFLTKLNKLVCISVEPYSSIPMEFTVEENTVERELFDMRTNCTTEPHTTDGKTAMERTMEDIRRYLRVCASRATIGTPSASHKELVQQEWVQVAMVIDRLFFLCFLVLTVVITISMYAHY